MQPIDIGPAEWEAVRRILRDHAPGIEVRAFGSRVSWTARETSDLDLVLMTEKPLEAMRLAALRAAFTDSDLPFRVDVVDWASTSEAFRRVIEREHVVLAEGEKYQGDKWIDMPFSSAVQINPAASLERGKTYPFIDMAAISSNSQCVYASQKREYSGSGTKFRVGDTLMARITPCLENGKIARYDTHDTSEYAHGSTEFIVIRGRDGVTDTGFSYYLTRWEEVHKYAISQMTGTSGRQRVPVKSLDHLIVRVPPLSEQRAIGDVLGVLDERIEVHRRMNETLEAMAQALFKDWFIDFGPTRAKTAGHKPYLPKPLWNLFPNQLTNSKRGQIPEGWRVSTIGEEIDVVGGSTPSTKEPSFWGGSVNWATPKDLSALKSPVLLGTDRKITEKGLARISSGLLPEGTVLLSSRAPIGYLAIADIPVAINQGFIAIKCHKQLSTAYVWLWNAMNLDAILEKANGSTFLEINKRNFRSLLIVVPPEPLIRSFNDKVEPLIEKIINTERETRTLADLRDTLLPKLISGKIRLHNTECQTGSAA